ncbi:MAG: HlyD family secretion protein [Gemmatimonadales bacterium]|nr:HlyD family secretion protein [Gemmatimonadales bacterium]
MPPRTSDCFARWASWIDSSDRGRTPAGRLDETSSYGNRHGGRRTPARNGGVRQGGVRPGGAKARTRRLRLAGEKIIAAQQLDAAQAAYDAAAANLQASRKQAAAAGSEVSASGAAVRGADARLASAQAAVENARLQLSYAHITAPTAGVIPKRSAEPGALVQVGQQVLSMVPEREVWVTANLKETQLARVTVGDSVEFSVDAYDGRSFRGRVVSLSPATGARFALLPPHNATGNFTKVVQRVPVRIAVASPGDRLHPLRPGMSVDVTIDTD